MKNKLFFAILLRLGGVLHAQVNLTSDLVICMPFSGNANDMSGNGNNGTVMGATLANDRYGNANSAYAFDGVSNYIVVQSSTSLNSIENKNELTIAAWCYINNWYQGWNVFSIFDRYNAANDNGLDYSIQAPVGCSEQLFVPNLPLQQNQCAFTATGSTTFKRWTHYAITYSKSNNLFSAYKNGQLVTSVPVNGLSLENTNNGKVYIGYSPSGPDEYSDGVIDEMMVYSRALTATEIIVLYNGFNCSTTSTTGITTTNLPANFVSVYPDERNDHLNFLMPGVEPNSQQVIVSIHAVDGKEVLMKTLPVDSTGKGLIDISDLPGGLYMINFSCGTVNHSTKFVKP